jgi:hypothetical protein
MLKAAYHFYVIASVGIFALKANVDVGAVMEFMLQLNS